MANVMQCLLLIFLLQSTLCAPQESDAPDSNYELDYFQPGVPTNDCLCVPANQCEDEDNVDNMVDEPLIVDPRRGRPQGRLQRRPLQDESSRVPECGPYHVCCRNPRSTTETPLSNSERRCGMRNPGGIMVNGRLSTPLIRGEAEFGEWPWQAAILMRVGSEFAFKCGGTLIDQRHVLTVAHCAEKLEDDIPNVVIRLGEWDTQNSNEDLPHEDYDVEQIILHPQYRANRLLYHDIAIVKLAREVTYRPHIDTACLPRDDDDFTGQDCIVTGWGTDAYKSGNYSLIMKEVSVPVITHDKCQTMLRKTRLGETFKLPPGFLCAGGKAGQDSCKGDGGGPLVCLNGNSYTVAGLVAWGIDCGKENHPGVYVDVHKYIDWIVSVTGNPIEGYWSTE